MTWQLVFLVFSAAALAAGAVLGIGVWYVRYLERRWRSFEREKKRETAVFLKTSIEHMEALHAGTARQIAVLKEHAKKLEEESEK